MLLVEYIRYQRLFSEDEIEEDEVEEGEKGMATIKTNLQNRKKDPISPEQSEDLWNKAVAIAKKQNHEGEYGYIMAIFKRLTDYKPPKKKKPTKSKSTKIPNKSVKKGKK